MKPIIRVCGKIKWIQKHRGFLPPWNEYFRFGVTWSIEEQESLDDASSIANLDVTGGDSRLGIKSNGLELGDRIHVEFRVRRTRIKSERDGWNPTYRLEEAREDYLLAKGMDWYIFHTQRSNRVQVDDVVTTTLFVEQ